MTKPTVEELQTEIQEVVKKHNDALQIVNECKTRFVQLEAIIKD